MKTISVCTPCFNEADNIEACYREVKRVFDEELPGYAREHIFADNCSTDGTAEKLRQLAAQDKAVKVILNARNFGIVRSSFNGICSAGGDAVFMFVPADLQDPPALMPAFVKQWEAGFDVVYGQRMREKTTGILTGIRNLYYRVLKKMAAYDIPLNLSDFQLLDKKIIAAMRRFDDHYPFVRIMPLLCSANAVGVPYQWQPRHAGATKQNLWSLFDQGLNGMVATSNVLVRMALLAGVVISALSILFAASNIIGALFFPDPAVNRGITTLIAGMFLLNGILLLFVGMIGEYVMAIHNQVRRAPMVVEKERLNF